MDSERLGHCVRCQLTRRLSVWCEPRRSDGDVGFCEACRSILSESRQDAMFEKYASEHPDRLPGLVSCLVAAPFLYMPSTNIEWGPWIWLLAWPSGLLAMWLYGYEAGGLVLGAMVFWGIYITPRELLPRNHRATGMAYRAKSRSRKR